MRCSGLSIDRHPVDLVPRLLASYGAGLALSFSRYFYRPRHLLDERLVFSVPAIDVSRDWVSNAISALEDEWELALNSIVVDGRGRKRHIGMIDFVGRPSEAYVRESVRKFLGPQMAASLVLYDSGRSIHGYSLILMGPAEWYRFLGRALLMNTPGEEPVVDERWIGHRLIGGYSALRWSANSSHHSVLPHLLAG